MTAPSQSGSMTFVVKDVSKLTNENVYSHETWIGGHSWQIFVCKRLSQQKEYFAAYLKCTSATTTSPVKCQFVFRVEKDGHSCRSTHKFTGLSWGWSQFREYSALNQFLTFDSLTVHASIECLTPRVIRFGDPFEYSNIQEQKFLDTDFRSKSWELLNNRRLSDIEFVVGHENNAKKFFGHRFLLSCLSEVFTPMLLPPKGQGLMTEEVIKITDIEPNAFMTLLRFIYRSETVVDRESIAETLYAAEKYDIKGLVENLRALISDETILDFFPFVVAIGSEHALSKQCWAMLSTNMNKIVTQEAFLTLPENTLKAILEADGLVIEEIELFHAYVKWANQRCLENGLEINDENRKKYMKDIKLIRFPIMTSEEFDSSPADMDILSFQDKFEITRYMTFKKPTTFITKKRVE